MSVHLGLKKDLKGPIRKMKHGWKGPGVALVGMFSLSAWQGLWRLGFHLLQVEFALNLALPISKRGDIAKEI